MKFKIIAKKNKVNSYKLIKKYSESKIKERDTEEIEMLNAIENTHILPSEILLMISRMVVSLYETDKK